MDADDEYEKERQDNIRKNQELMLSLGLNVRGRRGEHLDSSSLTFFPPLPLSL